ncbi:MAG: DNA endonuclease SmrA [Gammaproteobacteria bacterium]|nr:MAG: DNA endonuclease SmrA [Gammaproteobacteria bacterium]
MSEDDFDLFKQEMSGVKPIKQKKVANTQKSEGPTDAQLARRESAVREESLDNNQLTTEYIDMLGPHDLLEYKRPGVQDGVYRKLRLGKYDIEAVLDLHRKSMEEARIEVFEFINACMSHSLRTVMILHGKGERSNPPALLKSCVNKWLPELNAVMAFHSAQKRHGGTGAVYVLLRKSDFEKTQNRIKHAKGRV